MQRYGRGLHTPAQCGCNCSGALPDAAGAALVRGRAGACSRRTRTDAGTRAVTAEECHRCNAFLSIQFCPQARKGLGHQHGPELQPPTSPAFSPRLSSWAFGSGTTVLLPLMTAPLAGRCCCCSPSRPPGGGGKGSPAWGGMCTSAGRAITPRGGGPASNSREARPEMHVACWPSWNSNLLLHGR